MDGRRDAVSFLSCYAIVLIAVPSRLIVGPLGGSGTPAQIIGLCGFLWWVYHQVSRQHPSGEGAQPPRRALALMCGAFLTSYVVAMTRPISPEEMSTADLGMIGLISWVGVFLVAGDGIPTIERLRSLVRRVCALGAALATLGVLQFVTGQAWVDRVSIPGLSSHFAAAAISVRSGFIRPMGTTAHPIEYGALLAMVLPLAITLALTESARAPLRRWFPVAIIGLALALSISRSALVSAAVGILVLALAWTPRTRMWAAVAGIPSAVVMFLAIPGLLGTMLGLFTGIGEDTSAQSRVGSYALAGEFIRRAPLFGRGFSTFLPSYRILDNQLLGLLIEVGVVGLVCFLALVATCIFGSQQARRYASDPNDAQLAQALSAAAISALVSMALFDAFSFVTFAAAMFLVLGLNAGIRRIVLSEHPGGPARGVSRD